MLLSIDEQAHWADEAAANEASVKHEFFSWLERLPADREPFLEEIHENEEMCGITPDDYRSHEEAKRNALEMEPLPF
jgi:hypothetical protein